MIFKIRIAYVNALQVISFFLISRGVLNEEGENNPVVVE
ncbi:hypothetical protein T4D_13565 [Trichinella pseudospiralis]|uniref:Uncharacterized protein n=1 Tax=Trichinella pseudospiralis TaxID=6337 RepID=A0A0V1DQU3_TRIPS|nr:hypothetical protein T4D_13565 [Trichinella pseudospiralis]